MASFFEKGLAGAAKMGGQYLMATSLSDHKAKIQVARDKTLEDYAMARQEDQQSHALALVAAEAEALKATPGYKLQANELARDEQLDGLWAQFLGAEEGSQEQAKIENQITLLNRKGGRRATDLVVVGDGVLSRRKSEQLIAQGKSIKGAWTPLGDSENEFNALVVKEANAEYNSMKAIRGPQIGQVPKGVTRASIAADLRAQLRPIFFHRDKTAEDVPPPPGVDTSKPPPSGKGVTTAVKGPATKGNNAQIQNLLSRKQAIKAQHDIGRYADPKDLEAARAEYDRIMKQLVDLGWAPGWKPQ